MCRSSWRCAGSHDSDSSSPAHQLALRDSGRLRDSRVRNSGIRAWRAETRARQARRASRAWRRSSGPGRSHSFEQPQVVDPEHAIGRPTAGTAPFRDSITFAIFAYRQPPPVRGADQRVVGGRCWCASSAACADALVRIIAALLFRHRWASSSPCKARARAYPSMAATDSRRRSSSTPRNSSHRWLAQSAKNPGRAPETIHSQSARVSMVKDQSPLFFQQLSRMPQWPSCCRSASARSAKNLATTRALAGSGATSRPRCSFR